MTFQTKICQRCKKEYQPTGWAQKYCVICKKVARLEQARLYYMARRESSLAASNGWKKTHKERVLETSRNYSLSGRRRNKRLLHQYGLDEKQYAEMLRTQDGKCAACGRLNSGKRHGERYAPMYIDHDHKTGRVRGLLCAQCNTALGLLEDSEKRISQLAVYLHPHLNS
jgi:hypothetical protein